eukprot:gene10111-2277_t
MATAFQLTKNPVLPLFCHAWNKDRTQVCVSPGSNVAMIFGFDGKTYTHLHTFEDHTATITSVDWSDQSNAIVTCGHDRNAYVYCWREEKKFWEPKLVILRINRAATCVKWSPKDLAIDFCANNFSWKFSSVSQCQEKLYTQTLLVFRFSSRRNPLKSTILALDWHPTGALLAVGSADFKCRIFSAAIKGVDNKATDSEWGPRKKFGELVAEFSTKSGGGWVHSVCFSQDGRKLAFSAHDSCVYVADADRESIVNRLPCKLLPFRALSWVSPTEFVAAGFDYMPVLFSYDGSSISLKAKASGSTFRAMDKFRNLDLKGTTADSDLATTVNTTHQNCIADLHIVKGDRDSVSIFSTVGSDGKIVMWDLVKARASIPA